MANSIQLWNIPLIGLSKNVISSVIENTDCRSENPMTDNCAQLEPYHHQTGLDNSRNNTLNCAMEPSVCRLEPI